jgi:hypothetical protein
MFHWVQWIPRLKPGKLNNLGLFPARNKKYFFTPKRWCRLWFPSKPLFNGYQRLIIAVAATWTWPFTCSKLVMPKLRMRGVTSPIPHITCWRGTYLQTDEDFSLFECEMSCCVSDSQRKRILTSNHQWFKVHSFENLGIFHPGKQLYFPVNSYRRLHRCE